jgi:hypothetical protein
MAASLNSWINEQIAIHNIRVSPRLPIEDRVKRFYTAYAAQQGIALDDEDAELCTALASMYHGEGVDANTALEALYQTEDNVPESNPVQTRSSRQTDIRKCRRSPRLNK